MNAMGSHAKLGNSDKWWLSAAISFAVAGMLTGFWFSFTNLTTAARAHGWTTPYLLPLMIDLGIPTYVIIDHLIVRLGWKSRLPRLAAWGFAALTISLNGAAVTGASLLWRVVAAAAPAAWVLGIEVLRLIWRALRKDPSSRPGRIPAGRWLASPGPTFLLWRRMHLLGVTSWPLMTALEDARLYAADVVTAARIRRPGLPVPLTVARAIRSGRFPGDVAERVRTALGYGGSSLWEPAVNEWLASRLGLPEAISDVLSNARREALPAAAETPAETPSPAVPEPASRPAAETQPAPGPRPRPKLTAKRSRGMSPDALVPWVSDLLDDDPAVSLNRVISELHVGRDKAAEALRLAKRNRTVVAIGASR